MTDLVAKTRHKVHVMIFVDNKANYLQAVQINKGRNKIALEVVGDLNFTRPKRRAFAPPALTKNSQAVTESKIKSQLQSQSSINRDSVNTEKLQAQIKKMNVKNELDISIEA